MKLHHLPLALMIAVAVLLSLVIITDRAPAAVYTRLPAATAARHLPTLPDSPGIDRTGATYRVRAFVQIGATMYAGGLFPHINRDGVSYPRRNLVAFNAATGTVTSFAPNPTGEVSALTNTPSGLVAAGTFGMIRYGAGGRVVLHTGKVYDAAYACGHLWWGDVLGLHRDTDLTVVVAGRYAANDGGTHVEHVAVSPRCSELAIQGVFTTVAGQPHRQLARISLTAGVMPWSSPKLNLTCYTTLPMWSQGITYSPSGEALVMAATGGAATAGTGSLDNLCDAVTRFATINTSSAAPPACVNKTGGDSVYSVADVGPWYFIGGHFRWVDNPQGIDGPGPGAVTSYGIAGLATHDCLPITVAPGHHWNPMRSRGEGAKALYATAAGLWIGSDTRAGDDMLGCAHPVAGYDCGAQPLDHGHGGIGFLPL